MVHSIVHIKKYDRFYRPLHRTKMEVRRNSLDSKYGWNSGDSYLFSDGFFRTHISQCPGSYFIQYYLSRIQLPAVKENP